MTDKEKIEIRIDENKNVLEEVMFKEEERYFIRIEITKEKYEEIKRKLEAEK